MKSGGVTLNEIMGAQGGSSKEEKKKLTLDDLEKVVGERMPKLEYTPIGRMRLKTALKNRFGKNYTNLPGIDDVIKEFDEHVAFNIKMHEMKMIKPKRRP